MTAVDAVFENVKPGLPGLNETEMDEFLLRVTTQVERTTGAPAGSCKATLPSVAMDSDAGTIRIHLATQFENKGQATAAASLLVDSPPTAWAACRYLERKHMAHDVDVPVPVTFHAST